MAKAIPTAILDLMLDQAEGDAVYVCSAEPTTYAEAATTYKLAGQTGLTGGDFTAAAGDVSGRKTTLAAKNGVSITATGTATHVAITSGGTTLKRVTTCTSQALTSGGTVDIGAHKHELNVPT